MSLARSPPPPARPKRALSRAGVRDAHVPGGQVAQLRRRGELHRAPLQGARRVPLPRRAAARLVRAARVQQDPLRRGDGGGSRSPEIRVLEIPDGWAPHPPAGEREREGEQREARHAPRNRRPAIHPRPPPQLGEVFNGDEYYCDRPDEANPTLAYGPDPDAGPNAVPHPRHLPRPHPRPHPQAEDPDFDWKPRKEQVSVGAQVAHAGHNATAAGARTMRASTHAA